jgi:hypothetical protein
VPRVSQRVHLPAHPGVEREEALTDQAYTGDAAPPIRSRAASSSSSLPAT